MKNLSAFKTALLFLFFNGNAPHRRQTIFRKRQRREHENKITRLKRLAPADDAADRFTSFSTSQLVQQRLHFIESRIILDAGAPRHFDGLGESVSQLIRRVGVRSEGDELAAQLSVAP